jgi:hypothetical protein
MTMTSFTPKELKLLALTLDPYEGGNPGALVTHAIEQAANELEYLAYGIENKGACHSNEAISDILHGIESRLRMISKVAYQQMSEGNGHARTHRPDIDDDVSASPAE